MTDQKCMDSVQGLALVAKLNLREVLLGGDKTPISKTAKEHIEAACVALDKLREIALTDDEEEAVFAHTSGFSLAKCDALLDSAFKKVRSRLDVRSS